MNIRIGSLREDFYWITLKKGETIDLPEGIGRRNNLEEVRVVTTEGQIGNQKVETKQVENPMIKKDLFYAELKKIKGIGASTAQDIVNWGTKRGLIKCIELNRPLPFRDDIELKLRKVYG